MMKWEGEKLATMMLANSSCSQEEEIRTNDREM